LGFQSIRAPEITITTKEIREANWYFSKKVIQNASVNRITLTRGVKFFDSDFDRWMTAGITGNTQGFQINGLPILRVGGSTPRRTMMLLHFFSRTTTDDLLGILGTVALAGASAGLGNDFAGAIGLFNQQFLGKVPGLIGGDGFSIGPFDQIGRVPAKAYILHGCIPVRYKVAGDFDAASPGVSIAELDLDYEMLEEISLAS